VTTERRVEVRDLVKVRVVEARPGRSLVSGQAILTLKFEPHDSIVVNGEEVACLYASVTNEETDRSWGWRQAQVRYALGLDPVYQCSRTLQVPAFSPSELQSILGWDLVVAVDTQETSEYGVRLRVLDFYLWDKRPGE